MSGIILIGMPGGWEWIVILIVILLIFGGSKLPQLAKALGQSKRAFREGQDEAEEEARLEEAQRRERLNSADTVPITDKSRASEKAKVQSPTSE